MPFITDFGKTLQLSNGMEIPRFGFWSFVPAKGKNQVTDTSNVLLELFNKHGEVEVFKLKLTD